MKKLLLGLVLMSLSGPAVDAHPLGIFSVNRYARIGPRMDRVTIRYVMDVAEIPAIEQFASLDRNGDGDPDTAECGDYARRKIMEIVGGLRLSIDGIDRLLLPGRHELSFPAGQGGLRTIRLSFELGCPVADRDSLHSLRFEDRNFAAGRGWKEILALGQEGAEILSSSVADHDLTDELRTYPAGRLENPPDVSLAELRYARGTAEGGATDPTLSRTIVGRGVDTFAGLISEKELSLPVIMISLLTALLLGAGHALTPGHGKTVVAAYLVGSRGTARHAVFLGLTVTLTHTAGVFTLGTIALFASHYLLPEDLFPWLSLVSGLIVASIGVALLKKRIQTARAGQGEPHADHDHGRIHNADEHTHEGNDHGAHGHAHGMGSHAHLPPGPGGNRVSWKNLLALGISGGLLPCPSALVVLLSAVALGRIGFGLLLIVAFSAGLAGTLTGIGLIMVYAGKASERFKISGPVVRWLPVASAFIVAVIGIVMSVQALSLTGISSALASSPLFDTASVSILVLGFTLGLKHALDPDHLVAVSTIVSARKGLIGSSLVGGIWGLGHTLSLMIVGLIVIALHIRIPDKAALAMEFAVALMLIVLGLNVLRVILRGGRIHLHPHEHGGMIHVHPHMHTHAEGAGHHGNTVQSMVSAVRDGLAGGKKSLLIGMVHGLAGSAALMLVVLATIPSQWLAMLYIGIFGIGSVGGMLIMSTLLGLPFVFTARRFESMNSVIRGVSGLVSLAFGLFLAWHIGIVEGLFL